MERATGFVHWLCILWGLVYLITQAGIMRWFRMFFLRYFTSLGILFYCPSCTGFWLGLALMPLWPWHDNTFAMWWPSALPTSLALMLESGIAALALGRVWYVLAGEDVWSRELGALRRTLETERKSQPHD